MRESAGQLEDGGCGEKVGETRVWDIGERRGEGEGRERVKGGEGMGRGC